MHLRKKGTDCEFYWSNKKNSIQQNQTKNVVFTIFNEVSINSKVPKTLLLFNCTPENLNEREFFSHYNFHARCNKKRIYLIKLVKEEADQHQSLKLPTFLHKTFRTVSLVWRQIALGSTCLRILRETVKVIGTSLCGVHSSLEKNNAIARWKYRLYDT